MDVNGDDPFDSLTQLCILSDSQEDVLRRCSFAGDPKSVNGSGSSDSQIESTGVFMASLPQSLEPREQITPHDAYQTPPEQSGGQRSMAVDDPSLEDAVAVAGGAEVAVEGGCLGDDATGVDLGKNPDLGFHLEVQSTQQTAEIEIIGVRRREVSESEARGEGESASKRLKLSKETLGTASSVPTVVEKLPVDLDSTEFGGESKFMDHKDEMTEELVTETNGVAEDSGKIDDGKVSETRNRDQSRRVLPSSINGAKNNAEEKGKKETDATPSGNSGKTTSIILEILKFLAEQESEEDDGLENLSILDIVTRRGMTFPRPCWWPEGQDFSFK